MRIAIPYRTDKNYAKAVNDEMKRARAGEYVVIQDRDVWWPDPFFATQIERVIETHGPAYYTAVTNRVNCDWQRVQYSGNCDSAHIFARNRWNQYGTQVEDHTNDSRLWSGFAMVIPKDLWVPIGMKRGLLGVDNVIHANARKAGHKVYAMKGVFCWHYYSGYDGPWNGAASRRNKSHLT